MKRTICLNFVTLIWIGILPLTAVSQWNQVGSTSDYRLNGQAGIDIDPETPLHIYKTGTDPNFTFYDHDDISKGGYTQRLFVKSEWDNMVIGTTIPNPPQGSSPFGAGIVIRPHTANGTGVDAMIIKSGTGKVGIGTLSPQRLLHVAGRGEFEDKLTIGDYTLPKVDGMNGSTLVTNGSGTVSWSTFGLPMTGGTNGQVLSFNENGQLYWANNGDNLGNHTATDNIETNGNWISRDGDNEGIWITAEGKVGIGTQLINSNEDYNLWVEGGIITEELLVALQTTSQWPDYVFKPEYKLRTLNETEEYIQNHGHLPDMPSADEIESQGINVAEMDAALLRKIEEMTLYIIDLEKKIEALSDTSNNQIK